VRTKAEPSDEGFEEARACLRKLKEFLEGQNDYYWAAERLDEFLSGRARSLDVAFGLVKQKKRGAPVRNAERDLRIARKALEAISPRKGVTRAFERIAEEEHVDPREVRRIYERHINKVWQEALEYRLDHPRDKKESGG